MTSRRLARAGASFPDYTRREAAADRIVHGAGLFAALAGIAWLFATLHPGGNLRHAVILAVYCFGLLGMLLASAAYNMAPAGPMKARLRRLDHAMIFVMIAGSYTPFTLTVLDPGIGLALSGAIWGLAGLGIALKLLGVECRERTWLALYLAMGWLLLAALPSFVAALPGPVLALLLSGGVVYSLGSLVHARGAMRFHNAVWHAMVLVAASLHFVAVIRLFHAMA